MNTLIKSPSKLQIWGFDFRRRGDRRLLVIATYVAHTLLISSMALASAWHNAWLLAVSSVASVVLCFGWWALNKIAMPYSATHQDPRVLTDERQEAVRNRAMFRSYQWVCGFVSLGLIYWMLAATTPKWNLWTPQTYGEYNAVLWTFLVVSITLPHAIIAWTEPDFDEEV